MLDLIAFLPDGREPEKVLNRLHVLADAVT